ncbi:MAG: lamin tail domain-containing protein [Polyangiaceae bacterium]|nr:lamin tail domain-containing protein [Polyangiaceae bacterium]
MMDEQDVQAVRKDRRTMRQLGWALVSFGLVAPALMACGSEDESKGLLGTRLVINEVVPRNTGYWGDESGRRPVDEFGETDDWIELYNANDFELRLGGYFLSDDPEDTLKSELMDGLMLESRGFLLLWADGQPQQGLTHLDFKLSSTDDPGVFLSDPAGTLIDHILLQPANPDESFARIPDGTGPVQRCCLGTPRTQNICWRNDDLDLGASGSGSDDDG